MISSLTLNSIKSYGSPYDTLSTSSRMSSSRSSISNVSRQGSPESIEREKFRLRTLKNQKIIEEKLLDLKRDYRLKELNRQADKEDQRQLPQIKPTKEMIEKENRLQNKRYELQRVAEELKSKIITIGCNVLDKVRISSKKEELQADIISSLDLTKMHLQRLEAELELLTVKDLEIIEKSLEILKDRLNQHRINYRQLINQ